MSGKYHSGPELGPDLPQILEDMNRVHGELEIMAAPLEAIELTLWDLKRLDATLSPAARAPGVSEVLQHNIGYMQSHLCIAQEYQRRSTEAIGREIRSLSEISSNGENTRKADGGGSRGKA